MRVSRSSHLPRRNWSEPSQFFSLLGDMLPFNVHHVPDLPQLSLVSDEQFEVFLHVSAMNSSRRLVPGQVSLWQR